MLFSTASLSLLGKYNCVCIEGSEWDITWRDAAHNAPTINMSNPNPSKDSIQNALISVPAKAAGQY
jgi:hypothetical protein